jgi:poly-gamma-glutamate synthesis protein (capsule biosynthesis protein)
VFRLAIIPLSSEILQADFYIFPQSIVILYNHIMKLSPLLFCMAFFCGCGPAIEYVSITGSDENTREKLFIESLFEKNGKLWTLGLRLVLQDEEITKQPSLFIELFSSWEYEESFGDILISKTFFVPMADPLERQTNTNLSTCLESSEKLIPAENIISPFVALRVDGHALGDEGYPLVRNVGICTRIAEGKELSETLHKKINLIEEIIKDSSKPLISQLPEPFWVAAGGDLMLDQEGIELLLKEGPKAVFGETAQMLASSDIALVNLEGVISGKGERIEKSFNFRFVPELTRALRDAGIGVVLYANNHVFDFGMDAFLDSLLLLNQAGIGTAGAGINDEAASEPFVFERGNFICKVFGLASFPREWNGWDGTSAAAGPDLPGMLHARRGGRDKLKAKFAKDENPSLNIVLFHGGTPWTTEPDSFTREIYTELVEAGADLVIGSHPHLVQGFEWVLRKPVFWSLGDYVFTGEDYTLGTESGLFIHLGFLGNRLLYLEPFALNFSHTKTDIAPVEKLEEFYALSRELRER